MTRSRAYHHGDLRRALLDAAVEAMAESGPAALSLRDLARRAGVSHAAPAHHFGDKAGLLTALAAQGFDLLTDALRGAGDDLAETGVAYVGFAVRHRAHFEVMFRPDLYRADDAEVTAARTRAGEVLRTGVARHTGRSPEVDSLAAWSIVHGFATLWLAGALPTRVGPDPEAAARTVISRLFA
ncbi:TetR/AcrR family transcriptional regulator [Micromonospora sp. NPDC047548]|uniref:TetR/AcrR family transcriptional regulator n=1 Tax=Micromonospora sp. NPDC047548 TaxID=3155624 RepID=UPI0033D4969E